MSAAGRSVVPAFALVLLSATFVAAPRAPWLADRGDGTYVNPILHADYSDPDVVRVGADYYMTASSFTCVPGLPILHSRDLVNWRLIGHALPRQVPEEVFATPQHGNGCWAPSIRHHDGRFWIFYPDPDHGISLVTARDAAGPWSAPVLVKAGKGLIDPSPLWDDDGRVYLVHAWARSRAGFANVLTLNELSADGRRTLDAGTVIVNGDAIPGYRTLEGPKFYKRDGRYWIFAPAGGVQRGWQSVFRSSRAAGPYEHRIVLHQGGTDINGPHQGAWVETPGGEHWFFHFQDMGPYGRVVHLQPMTWRPDGWPVMGTDADGDGTGEPVRTYRKPRLPSAGEPYGPETSDEFASSRPGLQWQWQANPRDTWTSIDPARGALRLTAQARSADDNLYMTPHLLLQKWPAPSFQVTAALSFTAGRAGDRAGLIVFGHDYAWIGLDRAGDRTRLVVRMLKDAKDGGRERETAALDDVPGRVWLRIGVADGGICRFAYSTDGRTFRDLGETFAARQGHWVGAKVGVFAASAPGTTSTGYADWDWFRIEPPLN